MKGVACLDCSPVKKYTREKTKLTACEDRRRRRHLNLNCVWLRQAEQEQTGLKDLWLGRYGLPCLSWLCLQMSLNCVKKFKFKKNRSEGDLLFGFNTEKQKLNNYLTWACPQPKMYNSVCAALYVASCSHASKPRLQRRAWEKERARESASSHFLCLDPASLPWGDLSTLLLRLTEFSL